MSMARHDVAAVGWGAAGPAQGAWEELGDTVDVSIGREERERGPHSPLQDLGLSLQGPVVPLTWSDLYF